jgi:hypothetical protein
MLMIGLSSGSWAQVDRDIDRALHAGVRKQYRGAGQARRTGAERIHIIKQRDRAPDMSAPAGTPDQMSTSTGSVAPINKVGTITSARLTAAIAVNGRPMVNSPEGRHSLFRRMARSRSE